ncbi:NAD-P-binding protein [Crucibulum laeve]|uniref:NAD-P-binding protein n=1 Tax=Crucibulum laeve TaxID=68775 RepID=A0A5C3MHT6_9AGAR|nr:NAD-P-binding protein [Crucibulum laeve]
MSELIFVTGATGFLGSHIVEQLLKEGYRVRATARGQKAQTLKSIYADIASQLQVVEISDIAHDQFPEALKGVDAVIHVASPLAGRQNVDAMFNSAIEGSLNVLRQAEKAGVKRFVVTSSTATVVDKSNSTRGAYNDQDWNHLTKEAAIESGQSGTIYSATKKYAEIAVWEWAEAHPHVDVTTINPPYLYGPPAERFPLPEPDFNAISTNLLIYQFINPTGVYPPHPSYADFRDVAKAHVGALRSPPTAEVGRKRIIFASPHGFVFKDAVKLIAEKRPQLKERLISRESLEYPFDRYEVDFERIKEVTGLQKSEFFTFEETFLDTIDSLVKAENEWKSKGFTVDIIPSTFD